MSKIKTGLWIVAILLFTNTVKAQNLEEGKKMFFYEKYKSAKNIFSQINSVESTYWLGQIAIATGDIAGAKTLYQQALATAPNSPLLIAGMGHIELLEGKNQDARQRFETAISLSGGKNAAVLNAVGFANIDAKNGDADYAIDKLKLATSLKGMKDPDVYINLGDAYRKNQEGGLAQTAYQNALSLSKNYARATYKIGKIYQTQGIAQEEIYMPKYTEAIAQDPAFPAVYYNLYNYYYYNDVNKAATYLTKYLEAKGPDEENACYYAASMKYAAAQFAEAITESDKCIAASATPYPNLYGIKALAYYRLNDSVNAKTTFETYFSKQKPENVGAGEYDKYAKTLMKFPGNDSLAAVYLDKAVDVDTTEAGKTALLKADAQYFEGKKQYEIAANFYNKVLTVKKSPTKTDLYNAGYGYFRSGNYPKAINVFDLYTQKFPEDAYGNYMLGKINWAIDSNMTQGSANPFFEKAIQTGLVDSVKYKTYLIGSYKYFVAYYANIKKDKAAAMGYLDKILALDPADAEALSNKATLATLNLNAPKQTTRPTTPRVSVNSNGDKVSIATDGTITTTAKNGTVTIVSPSGTITTITKDGKKTVVEAPKKN